MKKVKISTATISFLLLPMSLMVSGIAFGADQSGTFDSFYREAWSPSWGFYTIGALVIGTLVYLALFPVTGPTSVFVTTAGTALGSLILEISCTRIGSKVY